MRRKSPTRPRPAPRRNRLRAMDWTFEDLLDSAGGSDGLASLFTPVAPYNTNSLLTPLVAAAAAGAVVVLGGIAMGAFAAAMVAIMAVYFLLTSVFGYELTVAVPVAGV